ncbi:MAG: potassium channel protein [Desulfobacteraceae bacterium]
MTGTRQFLVSLIILTLIITLGSLGYIIIEGWDIMDALFMTVITLTTVGFGVVHPMGKAGQLFTIGLIFIGGGFFIYVVGAIVQFMVEGRIRVIMGRRKLDRKMNHVKDHYIICGYGRIGKVLCHQLTLHKRLDFVVIEQNKELIPILEEDKRLYIIGDASSEHCLLKAGIERAKCLVAALATDTDNVFLVLTARQLNTNIKIMARSSYKETESKLRAAGANLVESPYDMGATSMAQKILRPTVTNFLDLAVTRKDKDIQMEELPVKENSPLVNIMLKDTGIRQDYNLIIIAIKKENGEMEFNPSFETVFKAGDTVIAVGKDNDLMRLEKVLSPS